MINWASNKKICCIGSNSQSGMYVLFLKITKPTKFTFGRYKNREKIELKAGYYVYHGLALNQNGPNSLGNKINYHLQRSGNKKNLRLREDTLQFFESIDLRYTNNVTGKKLTENIDRVLDSEKTSVQGILIFRSQNNIGRRWEENLRNINEISEPQLKNLDIQGISNNFYVLDGLSSGMNLKNEETTTQLWWLNWTNSIVQLDDGGDQSIENLV